MRLGTMQRAAQRTAIFQMKKGRADEIAARRFVAISDHPMRLRRPNGTTISRSGSSGKSAKRKPRPALVGAKFAILPEYPSERNIKGQVPPQRQTSLWRKCEPATRPAKYQQKEPRPRKSSPGLLMRGPICSGGIASQMGTGSLLPVRGTLPAAVRRRIDISKSTEPPAGAIR
jgi:hypothetical protein